MAKRRPAGDGMVRRRDDGRWEGRIVIGHRENGEPLFRHVYAKHLFDSASLSIIFWHNSILFLECSRKVAGLCITHKNRYLPNVHIALQ